MPKKNCLNCDTEFMWHPSQSKGKYCCNECGINHRLNEQIKSGNYTKANAMSYFKRNTKYVCSVCDVSEWNGKELRLQVDHIDGNNKNDKIENYRYLCPNCHTQTDTWGVKNVSEDGRKRMNEGGRKGLFSRLSTVSAVGQRTALSRRGSGVRVPYGAPYFVRHMG